MVKNDQSENGKAGKSAARAARDERLAEALKANLGRRKAQRRSRIGDGDARDDAECTDSSK